MLNISEEQYDDLCICCDELLQERQNNPARFANSILHVIREHPIFLKKYSSLFNKTQTSFYFYILYRFFKNLFTGLFKFLDAIFRNYFLKDKLNFKQDKYSNVFVSHFLNKSFVDNKEDFYFFSLPKKIQNKNDKSLCLLINYTSKISIEINNDFQKNKVVTEVLPRYLPLLKEIEIRLLLFIDFINILKINTNTVFKKRLKYLSAIEALSSSSHSNLRIPFLVKERTKSMNPNRVFTTYEGHPWERLLFSFLRRKTPKIQCVAYQHALIFRKQHSIKRKTLKKYDPDVVLCSGVNSYKKMVDANFLSKSSIMIFGSNRGTLENEFRFIPKSKNATILILSEGDLIECIPLVRFTINLSKRYPRNNFIIRLHPITSIEKVISICPDLKNNFANLVISDKSFDEDLLRSNYALYRGSTTIIKAVKQGLIPIYYNKGNEMTIDPFYEISLNRFEINKEEDLEKILSFSEVDLVKRKHLLIKYIDDFFSPIDYTIINKLK